MDLFLVFLLGIVFGVGGLFLIRPSLFTRGNQDFSVFEAMFEESMDELEKRHNEYLAEIDERETALLNLYTEIAASLVQDHTQSPKVRAVLELHEADYDVVTIAKRLGLGTGEVQLILSLNKHLEMQ